VLVRLQSAAVLGSNSGQGVHTHVNAAARLLLGLPRRDHVRSALKELHWLPVVFRIKFKVALIRCLQSTHAAAQTTSPIQCRRVTVIRDGLDSAWRPVLTILFHGQERNSATEPSLWPDQLYGTVYRQQFVKQTACIRSSASSKLIFLPCVLLTNYIFYVFYKLL